MSTSAEQIIDVEAVKIPPSRDNYGNLTALRDSILTEGLRSPITLWKDGTVISGLRRHRAHLLMDGERRQMKVVFVDTIEDAAKRLTIDGQDDYPALPWTCSEVARHWELLRHLDAPAARRRHAAAVRKGIELRRKTYAKERPPGRSHSRTSDYVLGVLAPAYGMSETTAKRLWTIHTIAVGTGKNPTDERRQQAQRALADIDAKVSTIAAQYTLLVTGRAAPPRRAVPPPAAPDPAPGRQQVAAWGRSLPQLEGLTAGLVSLGRPNSELTWDQVGPTHARLMAVRRDLEKIIKQMRESNKS